MNEIAFKGVDGGLVVCVRSLYSDDPSSNLNHSFSEKWFAWKDRKRKVQLVNSNGLVVCVCSFNSDGSSSNPADSFPIKFQMCEKDAEERMGSEFESGLSQPPQK